MMNLTEKEIYLQSLVDGKKKQIISILQKRLKNNPERMWVVSEAAFALDLVDNIEMSIGATEGDEVAWCIWMLERPDFIMRAYDELGNFDGPYYDEYTFEEVFRALKEEYLCAIE